MKSPTIAFIGGGNMAGSLIGGLLADGVAAESLRVADPDPTKLERFVGNHPIATYSSNADAVAGADIVVLATKPQAIMSVATELAGALRLRQPLVISIAAGVRTEDLVRWLGPELPVVRAMPNTPALVQAAATALFATDRVSSEQRDLAESILRAVGLVLWLDDETQMDAVTALSGSGPAYFFLLMEALEAAGQKLGLPAETARLLSIETAFGAARMALESQEDAAALRQRVTSPGGTTERALEVFDDGDLRGLVERALFSARDRSRELARLLGEQ